MTNPVIQSLGALGRQVRFISDSLPSFRWATVTQTDPLRVLVDGDSEVLPVSPASLVSGMSVGVRVLVLFHARRVTVLGAAGGTPGVPVGSVTAFVGTQVPDGWLLCDGSSYEKKTFPVLAAMLGATGTGDSFQVPDLRGRVPLGAGRNRANTSSYWGTTNAGQIDVPLGEYAGEYEHTLTIDEIPAHNHGIYGTSSKWAGGAGIYASNAVGGNAWEIISNWVSGANYLDTKKVGGGKAFRSMPPYYSLNFIIKT